MKNIHRISKALIFLILLGSSSSAYGESRNYSTFSTQADGQVMIGSLTFNSMDEYLRSNYFQLTGKRCGTLPPADINGDLRDHLRDAADCTTTLTVIQDEYWPARVLTIPVVVHLIQKVDGTGYLDDARVHNQIQVLNEDYAAMAGTLGEAGYNTMIQFRLESITRTVNDAWFNDSESDEIVYKTALGWDQSRYCNIYVNSAGGYLGYSYFPQGNPGVLDGLVIMYTSFGGRDEGSAPYDQGRTVVHEMGHYLGLYHTFEGYLACLNTYATGDLIVDTPAEDEDHYGCTQTTSCDSPDPIHNYMNYTDDLCMNQFTPEQANRMVCSLLNYRPDLPVATQNLVAPFINLLLNSE